ncbi:hypothetical protein R3X25_07395 [Lutibacter sp. TH_r2]|uniref:hypothetical protein n=1 Tax=Lutibacter sp. TH_r2 TaxID=3082083 RepID=UPI00295539B0|nr:hypothetical protein [Lutibacter sp. TH_r2]MDV7187102.1 hypothetical protein [Lutibacter sp. TH_r2]
MGFFKKILNFYIFSNIHVAIAGFCIVKITLLKYSIIENLVPFFVAFSIVVSYNFIRYYEIKTNRLKWFKSWFETYKIFIFLVSIISLILGSILLLKMNLDTKSTSLLLLFYLITLFYVIPFSKKNKKEFSFRNFPFIKIYSIAFAWAGVTVLFTLSVYNIEFTADVWIEFLQRFLILIVITLPFDIRDLLTDPKELKTIPQTLGVLKSKYYGSILLVVFYGLEFLKGNPLLKSTLLIAIITFIFLLFSTPKNNRFYTALWVESIPIFWLIILMYF